MGLALYISLITAGDQSWLTLQRAAVASEADLSRFLTD
jgi:hypothetical protein